MKISQDLEDDLDNIMEEKIRNFIIQELWELVDAVVNYEYYDGPKVTLEMIAEKTKKLGEIIGERKDYKNCPSYAQAEFIILNATRCVSTAKD